MFRSWIFLKKFFQRAARISFINIKNESFKMILHSLNEKKRMNFLKMFAEHVNNKEKKSMFAIKCNILGIRICNKNKDSFVISESSLHNWLTNKSKSCKDFIRNNYDDNYISWSLRNLFSMILSTYINLNCSIRNRSTDRLLF